MTKTIILMAVLILSQAATASNYIPNQLGCVNEKSLLSVEVVLPLNEPSEGSISEKILFQDNMAQISRIEKVITEIPRGGKSEYKVLHLLTEKGQYRLRMTVAHKPFEMPAKSELITPDEQKLECQFLGERTKRSDDIDPNLPFRSSGYIITEIGDGMGNGSPCGEKAKIYAEERANRICYPGASARISKWDTRSIYWSYAGVRRCWAEADFQCSGMK